MTYPSDYYEAITAIVVVVLAILFFLSKIWVFDGAKQTEMITSLEKLLESEKKYQGKYPSQLKHLIRNNPLRENIVHDFWGNEYYYQVSTDNNSYALKSKGKDGILNTDDDIKAGGK